MKTSGLIVCACSALLTLAPEAGAGTRIVESVVIDDVNTVMYGSLGSTRASVDIVQYIGCDIGAGPSGTGGHCYARNTSYVYRSCWTSDPGKLAVLGAIGSSSELIVRWNATTGECTAIDVTNTSYFAPMAP